MKLVPILLAAVAAVGIPIAAAIIAAEQLAR